MQFFIGYEHLVQYDKEFFILIYSSIKHVCTQLSLAEVSK